ncbi:MAG: hypothetical protein ACREF7_00760 [Candidatus Saccharimonadales bacterium]
MTDIDIPQEKDRHAHYRFFEILPGALSWTLLLAPIILSFINITAAVIFILIYLLVYFVRSVGFSFDGLKGYFAMRKHMKEDWPALVADVQKREIATSDLPKRSKWHIRNIELLKKTANPFHPSDLIHAVIIATVNEGREVLEPTIKSVVEGQQDNKKVILVLAYEGRAGEEAEKRVLQLVDDYKDHFLAAFAVKHPPNVPGEIIGKGSNISCAGRKLKEYLEEKQIDPKNVVVTTLDSDNRPDKRYFLAVSYAFCIVPDPLKASFQPLPMFTNNIWDAPTMMRVIATGNTVFYIVGTTRPHRVRNFSAHAQSMQSLIDMNFWSVRTIVEDGHQFWRSYFHFDGDYRVYAISIPVYQDAVLADGYLKTIRAQFIQLRRWTYGASDVAYVADKGFFHKNSIRKSDLFAKFFNLLEGHVTWATGTILIFGAAFIPPLISPQSFAANEIPLIVSRIQKVGLVGLLASVYVCLVTLPPRPARYRRHRSVLMVVQWVLAPFTGVVFGSLAAFNSQTRLIFKRYLNKFDVTEKAVVTDDKSRISTEADPKHAGLS